MDKKVFLKKESGRPRNLLFYIIYFMKTMAVVSSCQLFINLLYTYLTRLFCNFDIFYKFYVSLLFTSTQFSLFCHSVFIIFLIFIFIIILYYFIINNFIIIFIIYPLIVHLLCLFLVSTQLVPSGGLTKGLYARHHCWALDGFMLRGFFFLSLLFLVFCFGGY